MSAESILSSQTPVGAPESCSVCDAPLAEDQRYCLECGERRFPISSVLLGGPPAAAGPGRAQPPAAPPAPSPAPDAGRGNAVTVIAGVGVLLLAVGVGVLIGRSGGSKQATTPAPQVISVASGAATGAATTGSSTASFSDDWPAGTSGYTLQLQTLPQAGTPVSAVEAAKAAATAKGATAVGALKSEDFSSLKAGNYVIYSGVYHRQAEAKKAQKALSNSFPGVSVVKVSSAAAGLPSKPAATPSAGSGVGASEAHPAPPSVIKKLQENTSKTPEEKSKEIPDVVSTG